MSALALILTAAMVVPVNVPEMESGEMVEPQPLDLSGEWEGTYEIVNCCKLKASFGGGKLTLNPGRRSRVEIPCVITATGDGYAKKQCDGAGGLACRGTWRADGNRIIFHFAPANYEAKESYILILRRVKPPK